jgi:hypothetical protein
MSIWPASNTYPGNLGKVADDGGDAHLGKSEFSCRGSLIQVIWAKSRMMGATLIWENPSSVVAVRFEVDRGARVAGDRALAVWVEFEPEGRTLRPVRRVDSQRGVSDEQED